MFFFVFQAPTQCSCNLYTNRSHPNVCACLLTFDSQNMAEGNWRCLFEYTTTFKNARKTKRFKTVIRLNTTTSDLKMFHRQLGIAGFDFCYGWCVILIAYSMQGKACKILASFPGSCVGGEKRAWYRLFAHAQFSQDFWEFGNSRKICSVTLTSARHADFSRRNDACH